MTTSHIPQGATVEAMKADLGITGGGGGGELHVSDPVSLASADILSSNTSPIEVVPALGSGKVIMPILGTGVFTFGTTEYQNASDLDLIWAGQEAEETAFSGLSFEQFALGLANADGFFRMTAPSQPFKTRPLVEFDNIPLVLHMENNDPTDGDGALANVVVFYVVIDV